MGTVADGRPSVRARRLMAKEERTAAVSHAYLRRTPRRLPKRREMGPNLLPFCSACALLAAGADPVRLTVGLAICLGQLPRGFEATARRSAGLPATPAVSAANASTSEERREGKVVGTVGP